jgi:hypothetical protein
MTVESFLKRAAVKFKTRERAKAGGILLEAAEWLEGMGGNDKEVLAAEVTALQQAALTSAAASSSGGWATCGWLAPPGETPWPIWKKRST